MLDILAFIAALQVVVTAGYIIITYQPTSIIKMVVTMIS